MRLRILIFYFVGLISSNAIFSQTASRGILDLSGVSLDDQVVTLDGEWEFYWNQLLTSSQLDTLSKRDYYAFPKIWNDGKTLSGVQLEPMGFGTYRLKVILPKEPPVIAFRIKHFYCSYKLFVDGKVKAENGTVASRAEEYEPQWLPKIEDVENPGDTITIDLQIANFSHRKGGAKEPIFLSSEENIEGIATQILGFDLLLAGSLLMAGLFFCGLYFFSDRQAYVLNFAIFCLLFSYRILAADDYSLHILYPQSDWGIMLHFEYLSLFLPPAFFALYTENLYKGEVPFNLLKAFTWFSFFLSGLVVILPPYLFTRLVEPYLFVMVLALLLHGITYFKAFSYGRSGAKFAITSSVLVLLTASYKVFVYLTGITEMEIIPFIGFILFFFFQSLILFFIFTNTLKRAKEEAENASRIKSEFLSMMSHEIRTPMNAVVGLTNFLIEDNPKKGQIETLRTLSFSAKNLLVIINDILDFSKIEAKKITFDTVPLNIRLLIEDIKGALSSSATSKNIKLSFYIDARIPEFIICDPTRTSQILINLVNNAIKFTKEGSVKVSLELISRQLNEAKIVFKVQDTGIGISEKVQEDIFKSFTQGSQSTTREFGGTGLGLTITRELLALQGVDLKVNSKLGEGSTFYFTQKFIIGEALTLADFESSKVTSIDGAKILLVEDNEINVMVARKFLTKWGANLTIARNGQEALELYDDTFSIVIMDLQMPIMDGYEASRQLRLKGAKVPIMALTASALIDEQRKIYEAGMDDFVTKPFDPEVLLNKIRRFIK